MPIVRVHHPGDAVDPLQLQVTLSGVVSLLGVGIEKLNVVVDPEVEIVSGCALELSVGRHRLP